MENYYLVKVFDEESCSTTTLSRSGSVEEIKAGVEEDGWTFVSVIGIEPNYWSD